MAGAVVAASDMGVWEDDGVLAFMAQALSVLTVAASKKRKSKGFI
ncbi:hypothetical protein GCM10027565_38180 [Bordetella tumulicola]